MAEVVPLEQQVLASRFCQGVTEAVAEIQLGRVTGALAVGAIRLACKADLLCGDRTDSDAGFAHQVIQGVAGNGAAAMVDTDCGFQPVGGGYLHRFRLGNRFCVTLRVRLVEQDSQQR